jgi:hypothetical protein
MLKRPYVTRAPVDSDDHSVRSPKNGKGDVPVPRRGSRRGVPNKYGRVLKEALLLAAEWDGEDLNGKNGVTGYCYRLAVLEPKAFAQLLGKVLPLQVNAKVDVAELREPYETIEQAEQAMYELGLQPTRIYDSLLIDDREAKNS